MKSKWELSFLPRSYAANDMHAHISESLPVPTFRTHLHRCGVSEAGGSDS